MKQNQNSTAKGRFKPILKATLIWSLPVWAYLAVDAFVHSLPGYVLFSQYLVLPGLVVTAFLDPTWAGIHDYSPIGLWAFNCVFYSLVLFAIAFIREHRAAGKRHGDLSIDGGNSMIMKRAMVYSLPMWVCFLVDAVLKLTLEHGFLPPIAYYPGDTLTVVLNYGMHDLVLGSPIVEFSNSCLFFYLAILLVLYAKGKMPLRSKD